MKERREDDWYWQNVGILPVSYYISLVHLFPTKLKSTSLRPYIDLNFARYSKTMVVMWKTNKKFSEELIAYFPLYDTGHIKNDASNNSSIVACVFAIAVTFLSSRCLATIGGFLPGRFLATTGGFFTEPLRSNDRGIFTEPLPSNNKGIFTEPLPSNDKGIFTEPLSSNDRRDTHADSNLIS
jgi:hypothetical protein